MAVISLKKDFFFTTPLKQENSNEGNLIPIKIMASSSTNHDLGLQILMNTKKKYQAIDQNRNLASKNLPRGPSLEFSGPSASNSLFLEAAFVVPLSTWSLDELVFFVNI